MQYLLMLMPAVWFLCARVIFHSKINFQEVIISCVVSVALVFGVTEASRYSKMSDTEIWNGYVSDKKPVKRSCPSGWRDSRDSFCRHYRTREVVDYIENVTTYDSNGNPNGTQQVTHYKTQYNYDYNWEQNWYVNTTLGQYEIARADSQGVKTPKRWEIVKTKDPVSQEKSYTNYVKAVPDSLFNNIDSSVRDLELKVPAYPRVHDYYRINRVITVDYASTKTFEINESLGKALGRLNPRKQVNVNIIMTGIRDSGFKYAVEHKWIGGKKNDVTIFLGMEPGTDKINWASAMTFAMNDNNGVFISTLEGELQSLDSISKPGALVSLIESTIEKYFDRPEMASYQYLEDEVLPSEKALLTALAINLVTCILLTLVFRRVDFDPIGEIIKTI